MYPVIDVLIGWFAAAAKARLVALLIAVPKTMGVAVALPLLVGGPDPTINTVFAALALPVLLIAALIAMGGWTPYRQIPRWPDYLPVDTGLDRKRILGGTLIFLIAGVAPVLGRAWTFPVAPSAATFTVALMVAVAACMCLCLLIAENRQRAALQRAANQD